MGLRARWLEEAAAAAAADDAVVAEDGARCLGVLAAAFCPAASAVLRGDEDGDGVTHGSVDGDLDALPFTLPSLSSSSAAAAAAGGDAALSRLLDAAVNAGGGLGARSAAIARATVREMRARVPRDAWERSAWRLEL